MKFIKYKYKGTNVASVTLTNPTRELSLYPDKEYKLDQDNIIVQQWVKRKLLEPIEEVQIGKKEAKFSNTKSETEVI